MAAYDDVAVHRDFSGTVTCAEVAVEKQVLTDESHDEENEKEELQATRVSTLEAIEMIYGLQCFLPSCTNAPSA